jgi:glycosyltransferase involved in cell wall biosynthesis
VRSSRRGAIFLARVLFIEQYATLGGGQRILIDLVEHLRDSGDICAVCFPGEGPVRSALTFSGIETFSYALPHLSPGRKTKAQQLAFLAGAPRAAREIARAAAAFRADLLYSSGGRPTLPAVLAARRLGLPLVVGIQLIMRGNERRLLRWCFGRSAVKLVTFCSERAAEPFAASEKSRVVWNWVSPSFLEKPLVVTRDGDLVVGVLGRISRTKGQRLFLEALLPLLGERPNVRLAIGGEADFEDPQELERLRDLARASGHDRRVLFAGQVEAREFLDGLDILVVPSLWEEPFGLVAVEGMARELPVVATRSGSLPEIVADAETGLVVHKAPEALRAAVEHLLEASDLRHRMGSAGRERVERRFHPATQLGLVEQLLREALA